MTADAALARVIVGDGSAAREIAVRRRGGAQPGLFWLSGFKADMGGGKATALDAFAEQRGLAMTRFDYSGHGASGGTFEDGTISRWLAEATAVFDRFTAGPQVVVGSSMGGWLALLMAETYRAAAGPAPSRVAGLVLIAPAVDMTKALMWDAMPPAARKELMRTGLYQRPSDYSAEPYPITRTLIEDGERHLFGERPIEAGCPVHILQGMADRDVPWRHAARLIEKFASDDAVLTLIKDGDHRLSRPEDLERLYAAVEGAIAEARQARVAPSPDPRA